MSFVCSNAAMSTSTQRPVTSKARGVCRYYKEPRGCFAGDNCKFLHEELSESRSGVEISLLTPYDQAKKCFYYTKGFCKRGDACWFLHVDPRLGVEEDLCSICFEKPVTFGLLEGCSHIFCITCIKQWRDCSGKPIDVVESGNTKKCPMCRAPSKFLTPSSKFWKEGTEEKARIVQAYKESMAKVPCRYFQKSLAKSKMNPKCPFGRDCFYQHLNDDGTPYLFKDGIDVCMRRSPENIHRVNWDGMFLSTLDAMPLFGESGFDIVFNHTNFDAPWRRRERGPSEGNVGGADRQNAAFASRNMTSQLREVGRNLRNLNDAINRGEPLSDLSAVAEEFEHGMSMFQTGQMATSEGRTGQGEAPGATDAGEGETEGGDSIIDGEFVERLAVLADQLLTSLRQNMTPDGAQEDVDSRDDREPSPMPTGQHGDSSRRNSFTQRGLARTNSDESMPTLQSVSNSSESEDEGDWDEEDGDLNLENDIWTAGEQLSHTLPLLAMLNHRTNNAASSPPPLPMTGGRFGAVEDTRDMIIDIEDGDDSTDGEIDDLSVSDHAGHMATGSPPFVTDGRGRVVWSSSEDVSVSSTSPVPSSPKRSRGDSSDGDGGFTTDGRGRVISVGMAAEIGDEAEPTDELVAL